MTMVRTHYSIDLWTGLIFAHFFFILAERVSFFFDVLVLGLPDKKRKRNFFKFCKCCGWSNKTATDFVTEAER